MGQAFGAVLVLLGATFFHIASSDTELRTGKDRSVTDVISHIWDDILATAQGQVNLS